MFENDYKKAMENITPSDDLKEKITKKIQHAEEKKHKNPAVAWRVAFACVACVAVILGVIFVPKNNIITIDKQSGTQQNSLTVSKSYDEIYKLIKPKIDLFSQYKYVIEESEEINEIADGTSQNGLKGNSSATANKDDEADDFSKTNEQVDGVNEADIVKTDGKYIYYLFKNELSIFAANGENSVLVSKTKLSEKEEKDYNYIYGYNEMFLKDDRIVIFGVESYGDISDYENYKMAAADGVYSDYVSIIIYDISDPALPKKVSESSQKGFYISSRMVGDYIYLVSNCNINTNIIDKDDPTTFVPTTICNGVIEAVPEDSIYRYEQEEYTSCYTVIGAYNYKDGSLSDTASLLGGTDNIYCSKNNIILAKSDYCFYDDAENNTSQDKTTVSRLEIKKGKIEYKASGEVDGVLENQFFIDEHKGYFRFVTTVTAFVQHEQKFDNAESSIVTYSTNTSAKLTVLDNELNEVSEIKDLAKGERVYSVRFMGDIAYFVTFRQTDPLFSADLSDPKNPKILGALKIAGFSEYMYPYGENLLLGFGMDADESTGRTKGLKLSMFNISDPSNVTEESKTIIDGYTYSPALYEHKAMLVSSDKNLMGFAVQDANENIGYLIYEYTGEAFVCKASLLISKAIEYIDGYEIYDFNGYGLSSVRGMFINDNFYVVSDNILNVFDLNTFEQIGKVTA